MLVWTMLTGHKSFEEGRNDGRLLGIRGVYRNEVSDDEDDNDNEDDEESVF